MTSVVLLFFTLLAQPCAAHAPPCLANAMAIPPLHEMVPPGDRYELTSWSRLGAPRFEGSPRCSSEMLNLYNKTPPAASPAWCVLADEVTDPYNLIDSNHLFLDAQDRACAKAFKSNVLPPQGINNGFQLYFGSLPYDAWVNHTEVSSTRTLRPAAAPWLGLPALCMHAMLDHMIDAQMLLMSIPCLLLVYAPLVLIIAGGFSLILDAALAVAGLAITIAGLGSHCPSSHVMSMRIISFIDRMMLYCAYYLYLLLKPRTMRLICGPALLTLLFLGFTSVEATGRETPKVTLMEYFLPGVTRWNAIPYHDFRRVWWVALCAALGNINQEGYSLLQTARDQDLGAPGNPGTPAQTLQSNNRNHRLFGAILNYIEATSYVYHYVSATFANDGRGLFAYLYVVGHLPYTTDERVELEHEWVEATISNVGIKYTADAVFKWAEYVNTLADKLNKSEREKRNKYLAGFPHSFDVLVVAERNRPGAGSYTHPVLYPIHHPLAGTAHPLAGQPDIDAMAVAFYGEWSRMVSQGLIKQIPKGFAGAHRVDDPDNTDANDASDDEHACMARGRVSAKSVCGICGGIGHVGKVDGLGSCLTAKLGNRVSKEDLNRMQYPNGYTPPTFLWRSSNSGPSRSSSNHLPPTSRARAIDEPSSSSSAFEPQEGECYECVSNDDFANDLADMMEARRIFNQRSRMRGRPGPQPRPRTVHAPSTRPPRTLHAPSTRPPRNPPRARISDATEETTQNSTADANEQESDTDEHGRLAVEITEVTFN